MKPGNPSIISEWLVRSQNAPLTIDAEFTDAYEHPPCLYHESPTATLAVNNGDEVNEAVLSLDQLLPHRSRIRDLSILLHSSDPYWDEDDHEGEPTILYHPFFRETLPNLQRLDFRATHVEQDRDAIPVPGSLFAKDLPRLKELKYLGVTGGLIRTAKNLVSCEIGDWLGSAGPTIAHPDEPQVFFDNNKTVESLTINELDFIFSDHRVPTTTPMTDLKFLKIHGLFGGYLERILRFIYTPQFKNLDTVQLSLLPASIRAVATDDSGHTFEFTQVSKDDLNFHPLRHFGAIITTLRLDRGITPEQLVGKSELYDVLRSFGTVQALEFDGTDAELVQNALSMTGVFPELKVIRVAVSRHDCKRTLRLLALASGRRVMGGNPLTTIEPLLAEGEDELNRDLRVEWEESCKAENIQGFLSGWFPSFDPIS